VTPGPDGFPTEFYQVFWSHIIDDLMAMFQDFHSGNIPLFCLNFGIITLLPNEKEAKKISNTSRSTYSMLVLRSLQKCLLS
jgi:hypothetical protein